MKKLMMEKAGETVDLFKDNVEKTEDSIKIIKKRCPRTKWRKLRRFLRKLWMKISGETKLIKANCGTAGQHEWIVSIQDYNYEDRTNKQTNQEKSHC